MKNIDFTDFFNVFLSGATIAVLFFLSGGFIPDIFAFTSKSKPSAAGLVLEKATAEWVRGSFLKKVSESDMAFTATCNIATL